VRIEEAHMTIQVNRDGLAPHLEQFTFESAGDRFEQDFGRYVLDEFPNCQRFWQVFVVPLTQRMTSSPDDNPDWIRFREGLPESLEDIAMAHYSMFFNLFCAHLHAEAQELYSFEDVYVRLATACDLADAVVEKWYAMLVRCRGAESKILTKLSRIEFMEIAANIYDKEYADIYKHYLSKGRFYRFEVPRARHLLQEYLGNEDWWAEFERERQRIRTYRNRIVHNVRIGRILEAGDTYLVPKPECIGEYRTWRDVEKVAGDSDLKKRDFAMMWDQAPTDIFRIESLLNTVWDRLIEDFLKEFYCEERSALRESFDIEFSDEGTLLTTSEALTRLSSGRASHISIRGSGIEHPNTRGSADVSDGWGAGMATAYENEEG
jgi:hypothetical protein